MVKYSALPQLALLVGKRLYTPRLFYCAARFYSLVGSDTFVFYHFVCQPTSAVEDIVRRIEEVETAGEDLSMKICDDQPQNTGDNFEFGYCDGNSKFECYKPLYAWNPEAPGVCLLTEIVKGLVAGNIQASTPLLQSIYLVIQQDYTAAQVEIAKEAILEAIEGADAGVKEKLNDIDADVQNIKSTVDKIDANTKPAPPEERRRLGTDRALSDESIEELLRSHAEDLNEKSEENGVPGQVVSCFLYIILNLNLPCRVLTNCPQLT